MAAIWEALVDGEKMRLDNDGTLYLLQVFGVGLPPARRLKVRSPQQHGSTDIGFRYDEREMRLGFFFNALNTSAAVAKRDEIYAFWRSLADTPIQLRYTRDDNTVRQIDCHVVGVVDMPWNPDENQNGLQNFVVQVEAANPLWYDPTAEVVSFSQADVVDWWLALGTIDAANVLEYVENPTQSQSVDNSVLVLDNNPWTVFIKTTIVTISAGNEPPFSMSGTAPAPNYSSTAATSTTYGLNYVEFRDRANNSSFINSVFQVGSLGYLVWCDGSAGRVYRGSSLVGSAAHSVGIDGSETYTTWRGDGSTGWTPELDYAAIYNIALNSTQRAALLAATTAFDFSKTITYTGSFLAYPIITITGPITDPVLTNVSTGEDLDFTGVTIAGGDTYTIDCRFGYKTVKNASGVNKIADLTAGSDLATFHLGADPEVSGGANAFTLTGTGTDANTTVTITYNEQFVGA